MDSTSAKTPITIDNESESSWYKQVITRKTLSSIPDQFEKIPKSETLEFSHCEILGPTVLANLPQEASPMVFAIGIFDSNHLYMRQTVYAFVHGSKHNLVGFFLIMQDSRVYRIPHTSLQNIDFVEPFCDLGDQTGGHQTVCNRLRAIILHYFSEAGHLRGFGHYRDFWQDFTKSCAWIANKGSPPKLQMDERSDSAPPNIKRRDYGHTIQRPIIISRSPSPENPVMAKRMEAQPRTSKAENDLLKAAIATQTRPLEVNQTRVQTNHQLQEQITSLKAEVSRIKDEYSYGQNAYRGIQARYDKLKTQHTNALDDGEGLREQLRQSQLRCEQAEKRTNVLEAEVERLKRKMREARKALDDPSP
ncbi:unnamed protein product [Alternaria sp. RS040]